MVKPATWRSKVGGFVASFGGRLAGLVGGTPYVAQRLDDLIPLLEAAGFDSRGFSNFGGKGVAQTLTRSQSVQQIVGYQYAAMRALCGKCLATEMEVQEHKVGAKGKRVWEASEDHELSTLLAEVNEFQTWEQLKDLTVGYLFATGCAFWYLNYGAGGTIDSIWPLPSGQMRAKWNKNAPPGDATGFLESWEFTMQTTGGQRKLPFLPEEVVHFSLPSPMDMRMGFGPMMAAAGGVQLLRKVVDAQYWGMENGLVPSAIVRLRVDSPEMLKTYVDAIQQKYEGAKATGKIIGLPMDSEGHGGEWLTLARSAAEMGYKDSEQQARDLLLGSVGASQAILGITRETSKANVQGAEYIFASYQVAPVLKHFDAAVNQDLCQRHYGGEVRVKHDSPVPEDTENELKEVDARLKGGDTWNSVAGERGWPQHPWGDTWWTSVGAQPIGGPGDGAQPKDKAEERLATVVKALAVPPEPEQQAVPKGFSEKQRRRIDRVIFRVQEKFRPRLGGAMRAAYKTIRDRFMAAWDERFGVEERLAATPTEDEVDKILDSALDIDATAKTLHERSQPFVARGIVLGGETQRHLYDVSLPPFSMEIPEAQAYAASYTEAYWAGPAQTAQNEIKTLIYGDIVAQKGLKEIREHLGERFDSWMGEDRAMLTARTETTKMFNGGAQAFREHYQVEWKQWITSFVHSRESHIRADGQVRKNGDKFSVGSDRMLYPGGGGEAGENVNCHCNSVGIPEPK